MPFTLTVTQTAPVVLDTTVMEPQAFATLKKSGCLVASLSPVFEHAGEVDVRVRYFAAA